MCPPWTPAVQAWKDLVTQYGADLDSRAVERLLTWIGIESCGNPCSLDSTRHEALLSGYVPDVGPMQLFFSSADAQIGGYTSAQLRTGCVGVSQIASNVTAAQRDTLMSVSIAWFRDRKSTIDSFLSSQGVNWSERDRWRYYKLLSHGLPALGYCAMYTVVAALGRGPTDWDEFRSTWDGLSLSTLQAAAADQSQENRCTACLGARYLWSTAWHNAEEMDLPDESVNGAVHGAAGLDITTILAVVGLGLLYYFFAR